MDELDIIKQRISKMSLLHFDGRYTMTDYIEEHSSDDFFDTRKYCSSLYDVSTHDDAISFLALVIRDLKRIKAQTDTIEVDRNINYLGLCCRHKENFEQIVEALAIMFEPFERYFRQREVLFNEYERSYELLDLIEENEID